jgi:CHAD domain-containing protein
MADGKWIRGLRPDMPLTQAAREVLAARLEVVRYFLPLALSQAEKDPENVHQLRVSTRRSDAALRIFRACLSGRNYRAARARLRTLRRAAGAARDWDVFLMALAERRAVAKTNEQPGLDFLIGYSLGQRHAAQAVLETVEQNQPQTFDAFLDETVGEVREPHEDGKALFIDLARPMLRTLSGKLSAAASGDLTDYEQLHQVRIAGKRLRYAMEVVADCFGPAFRDEVYPQVEEMQEILGRANDSHVASGRLRALRDKLRAYPETWQCAKAGIEALLRFHQKRLPQERRRFLKWWQTWEKRDVEELLAGSAAAS